MPYPAHVSDTAYCYDGSFTGFLCCVFESYTRREIPSAVLGPGEGQTTLFGLKSI
ncbi:MAG: DNA metabolism protein, partial [Subdoligranulum sp.]|nr:DNA metabolism protein [Subdoligranulum sp.]